MDHPLDRAAQAAGLSISGLAERLGVTRAAVQQWKHLGRRTPAEHCPQIERLCNGVVRCEELNDRVDWAYLRATESSQSTRLAEPLISPQPLAGEAA